jgi:esterase
MGGKTAMALALLAEGRCDSLIVVDIAPRSYPPRLEGLFKALRGIEVLEIQSRSDADRALSKDIENSAVRAFLLKNLVPENGSYRWRIDLKKIQDNYSHILDWPFDKEICSKPTLFIKGEQSHYIDDVGEAAIKRFFPNARLESIADSGHWVHSEKQEEFIDIVRSFLASYE